MEVNRRASLMHISCCRLFCEILVTNTWLPGCLVTWLPGYLITWLPGDLVTRLPGYGWKCIGSRQRKTSDQDNSRSYIWPSTRQFTGDQGAVHVLSHVSRIQPPDWSTTSMQASYWLVIRVRLLSLASVLYIYISRVSLF